jgi:SAM-dependent methyltransferase
MRPVSESSAASVEDHVARLTSERVVEKVMKRTIIEQQRIVTSLSTYGAEAVHGFHFVEPYLPVRGRILEVGAGLGMLGSYLRIRGHDVVALEPCMAGFDSFRDIQSVVLEESGANLPVLPIRAEELNSRQHGTFDLIFSINVLEHIGDLEGAFRSMASVLAPKGRMSHTCPNYSVPYEPHFGLPLVPLFPRATGVLLPSRICRGDLWRSLNFITYFQVKRFARKNGLRVLFRKGTLADAFARFDSDSEFAARQSGLAAELYRVLKAIGLISTVSHLPPALSTPMIFEMEAEAGLRPSLAG